jgi:hypothetical protein
LAVISFGLADFSELDPQEWIAGLDAQRTFDRGRGDRKIL